MLDWIASFIARWAPAVPAAIRDLVHWSVHALASVVYFVFGNVGKAWGYVWGALKWHLTAAVRFVDATYQQLRAILKKYFPAVYNWIAGLIAAVRKDLRTVWHDTLAELDRLRALAAGWIKDVRAWAYRDIWLPLSADTAWLKTHLLKWGYTAWYYITHPDMLANILLDPLITLIERQAWTVAARLGTFTLALAVHNIRRLAQLAEDIIAAVF
ncbi:MAG TPA: hypothetical protein VIX86_19230 [Streptosporangiaceae bacterium]